MSDLSTAERLLRNLEMQTTELQQSSDALLDHVPPLPASHPNSSASRWFHIGTRALRLRSFLGCFGEAEAVTDRARTLFASVEGDDDKMDLSAGDEAELPLFTSTFSKLQRRATLPPGERSINDKTVAMITSMADRREALADVLLTLVGKCATQEERHRATKRAAELQRVTDSFVAHACGEARGTVLCDEDTERSDVQSKIRLKIKSLKDKQKKAAKKSGGSGSKTSAAARGAAEASTSASMRVLASMFDLFSCESGDRAEIVGEAGVAFREQIECIFVQQMLALPSRCVNSERATATASPFVHLANAAAFTDGTPFWDLEAARSSSPLCAWNTATSVVGRHVIWHPGGGTAETLTTWASRGFQAWCGPLLSGAKPKKRPSSQSAAWLADALMSRFATGDRHALRELKFELEVSLLVDTAECLWDLELEHRTQSRAQAEADEATATSTDDEEDEYEDRDDGENGEEAYPASDVAASTRAAAAAASPSEVAYVSGETYLGCRSLVRPPHTLSRHDPFVAVLLGHGGYFAGAIFNAAGDALVHKCFQRYVTRRGQGGRQSSHSGRTDTAGSQIRAHHEKKWIEEVTALLQNWAQGPLRVCRRIFFHAPGTSNTRMMTQPLMSPLDLGPIMRRVPVTTGRPTLAETKTVFDSIVSCGVRLVPSH